MSDLKSQHQRPEGALLENALKGPPKKSMRQLAKDIGFSEGRIRQIINGYQSMSGQIIAITGPADTVASMAKAAGVSAEQMRQAGRADVADAMNPLVTVGVTEDGDLWLSSHDEEFQALVEWTKLPEDERAGSPPLEALLLWQPEELLEAAKFQYASHDKLLQFMLSTLRERPLAQQAEELRERVAELENALSEPSYRTDDLIAADEQDQSISGEQAESDIP